MKEPARGGQDFKSAVLVGRVLNAPKEAARLCPMPTNNKKMASAAEMHQPLPSEGSRDRVFDFGS
jgi:hypothetical protein